MAWRGRKKPRGTRAIDRFAEALSIHGDVPAAATSIGIDRGYANSLFHKIKSELGVEQCR